MPTCLFCKSKKNTFESVEHIVPESLGNTKHVLPQGVVCDKCNQYFSKLENYFCHHHLASATKLMSLDKTKKGKPPFLPLENGEMRKDRYGKINFKQPILPGKEKEQISFTFFKDDVAVNAAWFLPKAESKKISRFLAKVGIETLYFKMKEFAFKEEFDYVRAYARFGCRNKYVPFLWCWQPHHEIDLYIGNFTSRNKGTYYFGTIFLPGIAYLIQLNRTEDEYMLNHVKEGFRVGGNSMNICDKDCDIEREPIRLTALFSNK